MHKPNLAFPPPAGLHYRDFTSADLPNGLALSQALGWSHGAHDWRLMARLGDGVAAELDGRLVGTGFLWTFDGVSTLGMMLVAPDMQRRGIGKQIMARLLHRAGGNIVTLIATEQGRPLYEQLGFSRIGENWLHMGEVRRSAVRHSASVLPGQGRSLEDIVRLDQEAAGHSRRALLELLEAEARRCDLVRGETTVGFAYLRPSGLGHTVGPVVAPDADGARALIASCVHGVDGMVRVDIAQDHEAMEAWLTQIGLPLCSRSPRMRRGDGPATGGRDVHVFALTNQALG